MTEAKTERPLALKACPWGCVGERYWARDTEGRYYVSCIVCGARGPARPIRDEAIACWNMRLDISRAGADREAELVPDDIRTETAYVARDESRHRSLDMAVYRNEELDRIDAANAVLERGGSVHEALLARGAFGADDVFREVTKDTPLIISHWQCRDEPGYRVTRFDLDGIFVWGNAGSWSGSYGNHVNIPDLIRYVTNTRAALSPQEQDDGR